MFLCDNLHTAFYLEINTSYYISKQQQNLPLLLNSSYFASIQDKNRNVSCRTHGAFVPDKNKSSNAATTTC